MVLGATLLPSCVSSTAGAGGEKRPDGTWSVAVENDAVVGQDDNYSNGIGVGWTSANTDRYPDGSFTRALVRWASFLPQVGDPAYTKFASFSLSQHIFTPEDLTLVDPPADDRPYSGGLFFDSSIYLLGDGAMHTYTLRLGVVGPSSFAADVQDLVHEVTDSQKPAGWDTQLKDEPVINLSYNCVYHGAWIELGQGIEGDVLPSFGIHAGNYLTAGRVGVTARIGTDLKSGFGASSMRAGYLANAVIGDDAEGRWKFSLYASGDGYAVAQYLPLDGNTFRDSRSVEREDLVGSFTYGFTLGRGNFAFSSSQTIFTKSFANQKTNDEFSSLAISWKF